MRFKTLMRIIIKAAVALMMIPGLQFLVEKEKSSGWPEAVVPTWVVGIAAIGFVAFLILREITSPEAPEVESEDGRYRGPLRLPK